MSSFFFIVAWFLPSDCVVFGWLNHLCISLLMLLTSTAVCSLAHWSLIALPISLGCILRSGFVSQPNCSYEASLDPAEAPPPELITTEHAHSSVRLLVPESLEVTCWKHLGFTCLLDRKWSLDAVLLLLSFLTCFSILFVFESHPFLAGLNLER